MANFKSAVLTTGSYTKVGTAEVELIAPVNVSNDDRLTFQIYNTDAAADTVKVYGRLGTTSGTLASANEWTQIGDDIEVTASADTAYKAIATTPLKHVLVHAFVASSSAALTVYLTAD